MRLYDEQARTTVVGTDYYQAELERRQTSAMVRLTRWITYFTVLVTGATLVNVGIAIATYLRVCT